jgi:hypothetical protein
MLEATYVLLDYIYTEEDIKWKYENVSGSLADQGTNACKTLIIF